MKTIESKEELHHFINEGEEDIKQGRVFSLKEAREIMDKWPNRIPL